MVVNGKSRVSGLSLLHLVSGLVQSGLLVGDLDGLSADWTDWLQNSAIWREPPISWLEILI